MGRAGVRESVRIKRPDQGVPGRHAGQAVLAPHFGPHGAREPQGMSVHRDVNRSITTDYFFCVCLSQTLLLASRDGKWKPELLLVTSMLNIWLLELALALPAPFFTLVFWAFGLFPKPHLISPGQMDLAEGRTTMTSVHLNEIVEVRIS